VIQGKPIRMVGVYDDEMKSRRRRYLTMAKDLTNV